MRILSASPSEVRSLLGMASYCTRFILNMATFTDPLRRLTCKDVKWQWVVAEERTLQKLKGVLTSDIVVTYFDPELEMEIEVVPVGLDGILTQECRVIAYSGRSLTDVETHYSQMEYKALAVVWARELFYLYVCGKPFTINTDHKPLEVAQAPAMNRTVTTTLSAVLLQDSVPPMEVQYGRLHVAPPSGDYTSTTQNSEDGRGVR